MAGPAFATIPRVEAGVIDTANPNLIDTGAIVPVFVAGANGSKIERVFIKARETVTAGMVRLWLHDGTDNYLLDEVSVAGVTPSGTVPSFGASVDYTGADSVLLLPPGWALAVSTNNAQDFNVFVIGADYPAV
jgi:hypothetical protein